LAEATSIVTESSTNNQQIGKKVQKNDLVTFVEEKLAWMHAMMCNLNLKVKYNDQHIVKLESKGGTNEGLQGEVQGALNMVIMDLSKQVKALDVAIVAKDLKLNACKSKLKALEEAYEELKTQVKLCMIAVANGVAKQVTSTLKVYGSKPSTYNGVRNAIEIGNFLPGLETYFGLIASRRRNKR